MFTRFLFKPHKYIKVIPAILLGVIVITSFSSCAIKNNSEQNHLVYYTLNDEDSLSWIIEKYNKYCINSNNPSFQIEVVKFNSEQEMSTQLSTEIMSGDGPDIISLDQPLPFEKLIENHAFADVDELINTYGSNIDFNDYNTKVMESGIVNRKRYFVPFFYCPNIFISTQEKLKEYDLNFSDFSYIDIFKSLSKFRHLFKLPNFKQKTVEKFLGLEREDLYSGGELINIYHDYVKSPDAQQADLLKLHNYEDVLGMVDLLPILTYLQLFQGAFSIQTIEKNIYEDYSRTSKDECIFTLKNLYPVPKRISFGYENIYFTSYQDTTKISIRIYDGELKYFYPNYKDYYYLPHEDTAVHKSVAFYVDKDYRTKAKAATCYSKKTGCFLPQYEVVVSPYFKLEYHDKMSYFELTDDFWDDEDTVRQYIMHIFSILLQQSGKKQK